MPPTHTDEGLQAASTIRRRYPGTAVLLLSSYLESRYASELLNGHPASSGYLQLLGRSRERGPLDELTEREREILGLMAEGHSICGRLVISPRTVESHGQSYADAPGG